MSEVTWRLHNKLQCLQGNTSPERFSSTSFLNLSTCAFPPILSQIFSFRHGTWVDHYLFFSKKKCLSKNRIRVFRLTNVIYLLCPVPFKVSVKWQCFFFCKSIARWNETTNTKDIWRKVSAEVDFLINTFSYYQLSAHHSRLHWFFLHWANTRPLYQSMFFCPAPALLSHCFNTLISWVLSEL